jgi:UDP-2,3-diacylglucosamine pyrophosphatase LpxH
LHAAACRVAQIFDVKVIVMGHSHRATEETVGSGSRYFNLGSWTPGSTIEGFPHVVVTGSLAQLRRWKGSPLIDFNSPMAVPATAATVPA